MKEPAKAQKSVVRGKRCRLRLLLGLVLVLGLAWIFHGLVLTFLLREGMSLLAGQAGYQLEVGRMETRLGHPWILEEISAIPTEGRISESSFTIESLHIEFSSLWKMFGPEGRFLEKVTLQNSEASIDARSEAQSSHSPMQRTSAKENERLASRLLWALPRTLEVADLTVVITGDDWEFSGRKISAILDEASLGSLSAASLHVEFGGESRVFGPLEAVTAWKGGEAFLADLSLAEGIRVETFSLHLTRPGGLGFDLAASLFGGLVRGGAFVGEWRGEPGLDANFWASGLDFAQIGQFLALDSKAAGILSEGRLNFRGNPARVMDAEISLRLVASDVHWGERGWNSLQVAASLLNRRLSLSELTLQQEENRVTAHGEIAVSGDWRDVTNSPFLINTTISIRDMGSLADLLGKPFESVTGRMSLRASLSGRARKVDGFLTMEASDIGWSGRTMESAQLEAVFKAGEARIDKLEIWSGGDRLTGKGALALAEPYAYNGTLSLKVGDLGAYSWIPVEPLSVLAGGLDFQWQGDGQRRAHSGAFQCALDNLVTDQTPGGISGDFSGTYSPGNLYFRDFKLHKGNLGLSAHVTLAASGIQIKEMVFLLKDQPMASGEIFLPLNPFPLTQGISLAEAVVPDKVLYASLETKGDLQIADLFALAGQDILLTGHVSASLMASGKWDAITGKATVRASEVVSTGARGSPPLRLELDVDAREGTAKAEGSIQPTGLPTIRLAAEVPFGLIKSEDGTFALADPTQSISVRMEIPETDLGAFAAFLPNLHRAEGRVSAEVQISGSAAHPELGGSLRLVKGSFQPTPRSPEINDVEIRARFQGTRMEIETFSGNISAGDFTVSGGVSFEDFANPRYDLTFTGDKILLFRSADARLRANTDLRIRGDRSGGEVSGEVLLVDGRIFKRLEVTPFITPLPAERDRAFTPPDFRGKVPPPFDTWNLNVRIANATPFTLVGNIASGRIEPEILLGGTLGDPIPTGSVHILGARGYLPFTTLEIDEGEIHFFSSDPWMPHLNVRGHANSMDYEIQLFAFGPLSERNLVMRSEPPLSQESILLLLGAGLTPGEQSGAGFGEAAVGQGGLLLLRTFARQFEWKGVDTESLLNRIQITATPPFLPGGQSSLRGSFRLWDGFSFVTEHDDLGFYNVGASYQYRFQ